MGQLDVGLQSEVMAALKETGTPHKRGTKSQANVKGSSMNNILIKRFEEMDWDNNGEGRLIASLPLTGDHC